MSPSEPSEALPPPGAVAGGEVTGEVLAAIVAAVEATWPRPVPVAGGDAQGTIPWRFSGRWWLGRRPRAVSRRR